MRKIPTIFQPPFFFFFAPFLFPLGLLCNTNASDIGLEEIHKFFLATLNVSPNDNAARAVEKDRR